MMIGALDAPRRQVAEIDYALLWSVLILLFTGLVFVYSASIAIAEGGRSTGHQPAYYLVRQGVFLCIGLVAAAVTFQVPLKPALEKHGRAVALIGRDAAAIGMALEGSGVPARIVGDMESAVRWLAAQAAAGDCVLLSPACASLDMYKNYAHRAQVFIDAVQGLQP